MLSMNTEISAQPVRLRWAVDELLTGDGHRINLGFTCSALTVNEPAERKLFAEVFGRRDMVSGDTVVAHLLPGIRAAAAVVAESDQAQALMLPGARSKWINALKGAANEVAFSCGVEVLAPFEIELTSPTLQRERVEQMQRIAAERRSADRVGHFARATELLKQWESLKASVPSISPGKLLEQINPTDRGLMLETLLMAGAGEQPDLWAVSGSYLVRMDVKGESPLTQLIPLPVSCGPVRSVKSICGKLYIGARGGVMVMDPADVSAAQVYHHRGLESEHGFTSVALIGEMLWACHREGGLVGWRIGKLDEPEQIRTPIQLAGEPKNLVAAGLFSMGGKLMSLAGKMVMETGSSIVAVLQDVGQLTVVEESGGSHVLDGQSLEEINVVTVSGKLNRAALLPWLSASRLLLIRADGRMECVGLEDQLVTQFNAGNTGLRAAAACAGKVVAMSTDRQRILLWNAWDGRKTVAEIYLTGQTHHRVADFTFA